MYCILQSFLTMQTSPSPPLTFSVLVRVSRTLSGFDSMCFRSTRASHSKNLQNPLVAKNEALFLLSNLLAFSKGSLKLDHCWSLANLDHQGRDPHRICCKGWDYWTSLWPFRRRWKTHAASGYLHNVMRWGEEFFLLLEANHEIWLPPTSIVALWGQWLSIVLCLYGAEHSRVLVHD